MEKRFKQYLGVKMVTQKQVAKESGISISSMSHFMKTGAISLDNFRKIMQVCQDLSLDYLFYGYGPMMKESSGITVNCGTNSGTINNNSPKDNSVAVNNMSGRSKIQFQSELTPELMSLIQEKDHIIMEKDKVITKRDETISVLTGRLSSSLQ